MGDIKLHYELPRHTCSCCGKEKPVTEFYTQSITGLPMCPTGIVTPKYVWFATLLMKLITSILVRNRFLSTKIIT